METDNPYHDLRVVLDRLKRLVDEGCTSLWTEIERNLERNERAERKENSVQYQMLVQAQDRLRRAGEVLEIAEEQPDGS